MKNIFLSILLMFGMVLWVNSGEFQGSSASATRELIISGNIDQKLCFTHISASGTNFPIGGYTVTLEESPLISGTTFFAITKSTSGVSVDWPYDAPICTLRAGTSVYMTVVGAVNVRKNWVGFTKP